MEKRQIGIPDWLRHELNNWSRWCWRGPYPHPLPPTHCASPEWQYERVREEGEIESVDGKPIPVNDTNARIVQAVYEVLPRLSAQALRAEFPQRHAHVVRKRLVGEAGRQAYEAALNVALFRVMVAFDGRCE